MTRRAHGETLAMVLKALREHRNGLTTAELSRETGIDRVLLCIQLGNFRGAGHIESVRGGGRSLVWFIETLHSSSRQLVTPPVPAPAARSVFLSAPTVAPQFALSSSRVLCGLTTSAADCCVAPDDFTEGAFMADWRARTSSTETEGS